MGDFLDDHIEEILKNESPPKEVLQKEIEEDYNRLMTLRINSITILDHPILGRIKLDLCQEEGEPQGVYTTVIIGANGIGKSRLLGALAEIFCCLESLYEEKEPNVPRYYFDIVLLLSDKNRN